MAIYFCLLGGYLTSDSTTNGCTIYGFNITAAVYQTMTAEGTSSSKDRRRAAGLEPGVLPRLGGVSRVPTGSGIILNKKEEHAQHNKEVLALAEDSARRLKEAKDTQVWVQQRTTAYYYTHQHRENERNTVGGEVRYTKKTRS